MNRRKVKNLHIALVPEGRHILGNLSVMENLQRATSKSKKPISSLSDNP